MKAKALRRFRKEIGNALKNAREATGWTLQDVADEIGVSYQMIQHYEKGSKAMDISRFVDLCRYLQLGPGKTLNEVLNAVNRRDNV